MINKNKTTKPSESSYNTTDELNMNLIQIGMGTTYFIGFYDVELITRVVCGEKKHRMFIILLAFFGESWGIKNFFFPTE